MNDGPFSEEFSTKLRQPEANVDIFVIICAIIIVSLCFLVGHKLVLPKGINIKLPESILAQQMETKNVITVKSENLLILNDEISSLKTLKFDLSSQILRSKKMDFNVPILLRVDSSVSLECVIKVCEILRVVGYSSVNLAVNKPS